MNPNQTLTPDPKPDFGGSAGAAAATQQKAARQMALDVKNKAADTAAEATQKVKAGAAKVTREASNYLDNVVRTQKETLAEKIEEYRDAARAAVDKLQDEEHATAARKIDTAAAKLDEVAGFLRRTEPSDLLAEAGEFAHRRPEIVFGGLFLAGLGLARFLKASRRPRRSNGLDYQSSELAQSGASSMPRGYSAPEGVHASSPAMSAPSSATSTGGNY